MEEKWKKRVDKVVNDNEKSRRKERNKQQYLFQEALEQGEEKVKTLYKKLYQISQFERLLLYATGMMRNITHDKALFDLDDLQ